MTNTRFQFTRRTVLAASLAAGATLCLPGCRATPEDEAARWTRRNVNSPDGIRNLATYKIAVREMLDLPAKDPRNWYRQAIVHLLDCPHGNWWFFNWHRPFLGYFEQICREVTEEASFALPYWDWTADPQLPEPFWDNPTSQNILDPTSNHFFANADDFLDAFDDALNEFWGGLTTNQKAALVRRHNLDSLSDLEQRLRDSYFGGAQARGATAKAGELEPFAQSAVSVGVLKSGLAADLFDEESKSSFPTSNVFNSPITTDHSAQKGYEVIEGQPHNSVHGSISGLMGRFLSPIDPIFWLHHANIDRIWTVWSSLQSQRGKPDTPTSKVAAAFNTESYLFFVNGKGIPVTQDTTAGDYMSTAKFDYDYAGGSSVEQNAKAMAGTEAILIEATIQRAEFGVDDPATGIVSPAETEIAFFERSADQELLGVVQVQFTPIAEGEFLYHLFLTGEGETPDLSIKGKDYVGTFTFFGPPHMIAETSVSIALADWLASNPDRLGRPLTAHFSAESRSDDDKLSEGRGSLQSVTLRIF